MIAILQYWYDVIAVSRMVRFGRNLAGRSRMTCRLCSKRKNPKFTKNSNMADVIIFTIDFQRRPYNTLALRWQRMKTRFVCQCRRSTGGRNYHNRTTGSTSFRWLAARLHQRLWRHRCNCCMQWTRIRVSYVSVPTYITGSTLSSSCQQRFEYEDWTSQCKNP